MLCGQTMRNRTVSGFFLVEGSWITNHLRTFLRRVFDGKVTRLFEECVQQDRHVRNEALFVSLCWKRTTAG